MKWFKRKRFCYACNMDFSKRELEFIQVDKNANNIVRDLVVDLVISGVVCYNCKRYRVWMSS